MKKLLTICFLAVMLVTGMTSFVQNAKAQGTATTLIQYWNFNTLGTYLVPNVPHIKADYSSIDTSTAYLEYYLDPGTSNTFGVANGTDNIDPVASAADSNLRNGAVAGQALRVRNPVDSIQLRWHIPSTGYKNLVITYELESSSTASGDSTQIYDYSVDGGTTWKNATITVNGVKVDTLDVTQTQYQGAIWGLVTITFGNDTMVNNNPDLIFRIIYRGNASKLSGNNRFDDVTLDGVAIGSSKPPAASITMTAPLAGNIFVPGRQATISFTTFSTVGQLRTIQFSPDGGTTWTPVGTVTGATSYVWNIPGNTPATSDGIISVTDSAGVTAQTSAIIIYPVTSANRLVHYWDFNSLGGPFNNPNIPAIPADFSADASNSGSIRYVLEPGTSNNYSGYIDNVAGTDTNARVGASVGYGMRVRNPTDSMELRFVIPTTGYTGISVSYALQSSSLTGPQVEHFTYSIDGGTTWIATGITVNGSNQDSLDVTQSQYQETANGAYGLVTVGFGTQTTMDNNPNFILRIKFGDTATGGSSGNNRFDNISVDAQGTTSAGVNNTVQILQSLAISPNPATDFVSFQNPYATPTIVSVLDILGQEVLRMDAPSSNVELNTSKLSAGSYYIHIQNVSTGAEQMAKFVRQ